MSLVTADEAKKIRALGIGKRAMEATLATARREARADALRECLDIAMSEGSTSVITQRIHDLMGGE